MSKTPAEVMNAMREMFRDELQAVIGESIEAVYPQAQIQRCIIHQIRSSTRCVSARILKL